MPSEIEDWKERLEEESDDATLFTLEHKPVQLGKRYCAQRIAVLNEDNDYDQLIIAVRRINYDHVIEQQLNPVEDSWYWITDPIYLTPGEYIVIRMYGTTVGDKVKAHITGYKEKFE